MAGLAAGRGYCLVSIFPSETPPTSLSLAKLSLFLFQPEFTHVKFQRASTKCGLAQTPTYLPRQPPANLLIVTLQSTAPAHSELRYRKRHDYHKQQLSTSIIQKTIFTGKEIIQDTINLVHIERKILTAWSPPYVKTETEMPFFKNSQHAPQDVSWRWQTGSLAAVDAHYLDLSTSAPYSPSDLTSDKSSCLIQVNRPEMYEHVSLFLNL